MADLKKDLPAWAEGFKAGYAGGFADGYVAGLAAGRQGAYLDERAARKQAKREAKALRYQAETPGPAPRAAGSRARVISKELIAPNMVRLHAQSNELRGAKLWATDSRIKILFPTGKRAYTIRRLDPDSGEMDLDFFLHGDVGIAGPWARAVEPGAEFYFHGPKGKWRPDPHAQHFVFVGDETAAPAIAAGLENLPASADAVVFLEIEGAGCEIPLGEGLGNVEVHWVHRGQRSLADVAAGHNAPTARTQWFVHGESGMVRRMREELVKVRHLDKRSVSLSGYWKRR